MPETVERRIAELLNDPLTGLLMEADHVDRDALAEQLRGVAERGERTAEFSPRADLATRNYEPLRHPRPRATKNPRALPPFSWCGARAQ